MHNAITPVNLLDARVKTAWRLQALLWAVPLVLVALAFLGLAWTIVWLPIAVPLATLIASLTAALVAVTLVPEIRYRRWRWEVRDEEVRLQEGLIVVTQKVIPMVRIQHVETARGPIMAALDLSDVHIWTAAGQHTIPALREAHAAELRDRIATLARVTDDGGL